MSSNGTHPLAPSGVEATPPALEVEALEYAYPDGQPALRGVSLRIERGERVALLGPNGAGKSTLLLHLNGILRGTGTIRVFGLTLEDRTLREIRARVGLLFSNPDDQLFSATVLEDVAYGPLYMGLPRDEVLARARRALEQVGMPGFEDRVPHHLSLGQKKRVAIATVLAMGSELLALDEPSASLSPTARRDLLALLCELPQAMVIATHDVGLARAVCGRTVVLDEGVVVADGPTEAVLADPALAAAYGLDEAGIYAG